MRSDDLRVQGVSGLLITYASILHILRTRGIIRSFNSPVADIAEWLVSKKLGLTLAPKSGKSFDATDSNGKRYQIKGRWLAGSNRSTQLSAIRDLDADPFDFLVGVVFDEDFRVDYAAIVPVAVVRSRSSFVARTNSHRFLFPRSLLSMAGVTDISDSLRVYPPTKEEEKMLAALASVDVHGANMAVERGGKNAAHFYRPSPLR
ncbi:MAG: hypothetical protein ACT4NV_04520 [Rhodoferax sp.]